MRGFLILDKKNESRIIDFVLKYRNDWPACARDIFDLRLDPKQDEILDAIQNNPRVSVKSGNARLNEKQRRIKKLIEDKKVVFEEIRIKR